MKKLLCILLVISTVFLFGCSKDGEEETDAVFSAYLAGVDTFEGVVHEYGEEESRVLVGEKLVATVFYPETGITRLDKAINEWTSSLISDFQTESSEKNLAEPAELLVYYNCYLSKNGTVSVELIGTYADSTLAHPVDIIETFVADSESGEILLIDPLLKDGKRKEIEERLMQEFDIDLDYSRGDLLSKWVFENDSLKIILERGEFLPMSAGTQSFVFTKAETKELMKEADEKEQITESSKEAETEKETGAVHVQSEKVQIDPDRPMIALTFDDGPSAHTKRLLDIFRKYGGKGTFFVLGNSLDNRTETLKRIVSEGHGIGNHSWNHRQFTNISIEEVEDQIMMTRAKIYDITGVDCTIVRPPYGACNDEIRSLGKELGVSFVNWSVDTLDWKSKNADAVYNEIMNDVADGHIILCHDLHKTTVDAMERVIPDLIEKGYQLVTVTELLSYGGDEITAGKMYFKKIKQR